MTPKALISYSVQDLTDVFIADATVYTSPTINEIEAVRFLYATVNTINGIDTNVQTLNAFVEYEVTSGSVNINGFTYVAGNKIYLANDTDISGDVIAGNVVVSQTGYYGGICTWLPSDGTSFSLTPSQMIYGDTSEYFSDNVFTVKYEQYGVGIAAGTNLANGTTYIVKGTQGDSILFNNYTYYVGEVFTADATDSFSDVSGTNYACPLEGTGYTYFYTWYQAWNIWTTYMNTIAKSYQTTAEFDADFVAVTARVGSLGMYAGQQFGVSLEGINAILTDINFNYVLPSL